MLILGPQKRKEKKQFRVKFTTAEMKNRTLKCEPNTIPVAKEIFLKERERQKSQRPLIHERKQTPTLEEESQTQSNLSKRQLQIKYSTLPSPIVQYNTISNSSKVVSDLDLLAAYFPYEVTFKLIFRASNHGFKVSEFHNICDFYQNTLTICLTEDNKIIGGYTPLNWQDQYAKNYTHFKTDFKRETFLFSLSDNCKYPLLKSLKNKAICCFNSYGPTFGGGYDLLIGDRANELPNTASYFPRNFQHPKGPNYNKREFTGTSRKNFKLQEWQVFQVIRPQCFNTIQNFNFDEPPSNKNLKREKSLLDKLKTAARDIIHHLCSDN